MRTFTANFVVGFTALLALGCSQGGEKIRLRFKHEPGMRVTYNQSMKRNWEETTADSVIDKGSYAMKSTVVETVMDVTADGTAEVLDTTSWTYTEPNKEDSTLIDTIDVSHVTTFFVQPNGKLSNIIFDPGNDLSSITWLKNYYEQGWPVFPPSELSPGYSWTQTTRVLLPDESMDASTTYTLKSLVREAGYDCAVIEFNGNLVIPVQPCAKDTLQRQGFDRIKTSGVIYWAYREGVTVLNRQYWSVDGDRQTTCKGKTEQYKITVETDTEIRLASLTRP